jgi:hypothetical protein
LFRGGAKVPFELVIGHPIPFLGDGETPHSVPDIDDALPSE